MRSLERSPQAERELAEIADHLAQQSPQAALDFLEAAEAACCRIADFPEIGGIYETLNRRLQGLRVWPIPKFEQYLIFYRLRSEIVDVVHVLHGARDLEHL